MLDFDRPPFHAHAAAIPRIRVAKHPPTPECGGVERRRKRRRAAWRFLAPLAWTLLGHSAVYRMTDRNPLPSEFSLAISPRGDEARIRSRRADDPQLPLIGPSRPNLTKAVKCFGRGDCFVARRTRLAIQPGRRGKCKQRLCKLWMTPSRQRPAKTGHCNGDHQPC